MLRLAHIVNPFLAPKSSDLRSAQPITFESMRVARDFAWARCHNDIDIELLGTIYRDSDDIDMFPEGFKRVGDLTHSTMNLGEFTIPRKLPFFREILDNLYDSTDADWFIQTNADIGLQPYFYTAVAKIIEMKFDAFVINKRILPANYTKVDELPLMYTEIGGAHAGCDCFVYPRMTYPSYRIGEICMGTPWSETTMAISMAFFAKKMGFFRNPHLTFHIGDSRIWLDHKYDDYRFHNTNEFGKVLTFFKKQNKKFMENETASYFLGKLKNEVHGYGEENYCKECLDLVK